MGKFTDGYFAFPIKIYDSESLERALELGRDLNITTEAEWISGVARVGYNDIVEGMTWQDGYSNGRTIEDVRKDGFDLTLVYSDKYGEFTCTWPRKKFEEKLNDFIAKQEIEEEKEESNLTL